MTIISFGRVNVPSPGTPVVITSDTTIFVSALVVSQKATSTGITYLGLSTLNKSTGVGELKEFIPPGASGFVDEHTVTCDDGGNTIRVSDFRIDANTANDGLVVYAIQV